MFRSKRSVLVKRLWRYKLQNETRGTTETPEDLEIKSTAQSMLKRLKEKQLDTLIQSIERKGGEDTECVLVPKGDMNMGRKSVPPHFLCLKLWRFTDITNQTELKRLPCCASANDTIYECCNPHHWSILTKPDFQVTTFDWAELEKVRHSMEDIEPIESPPDDPVSMETGMTPTARRIDCVGENDTNPVDGNDTTAGCRRPHWSSVAFWELRKRIGRLLTVFESQLNIFQQLPHGDGLCLQLLQDSCSDADDDVVIPASVTRTREKIGYGIILSKESDGVWAYNRSQYPVFVNSPTLDKPNARTLYVHRVNPGYSLKIFDYDRAHLMGQIRDPKYLDGPYDPCSVRISFAKGWGPNFSRQFITSCPCWLEILLNLDR